MKAQIAQIPRCCCTLSHPPTHSIEASSGTSDPCGNLLTSFEHPCEGPPRRLQPLHQTSPIQAMGQHKSRT